MQKRLQDIVELFLQAAPCLFTYLKYSLIAKSKFASFLLLYTKHSQRLLTLKKALAKKFEHMQKDIKVTLNMPRTCFLYRAKEALLSKLRKAISEAFGQCFFERFDRTALKLVTIDSAEMSNLLDCDCSTLNRRIHMRE